LGLVAVRFLFKRGDIDFLSLFKQTLVANFWGGFFGFLAGRLKPEFASFVLGTPLLVWFGLQGAGYFFYVRSFFQLRSRDQTPGAWQGWAFSCVVMGLLVAHAGAMWTQRDSSGLALLVSRPEVAPFTQSGKDVPAISDDATVDTVLREFRLAAKDLEDQVQQRVSARKPAEVSQ